MKAWMILPALFILSCEKNVPVATTPTKKSSWTTEAGLPERLPSSRPTEHVGLAFHMTTGLHFRSIIDDESKIYFSDRSIPESSYYVYEIAFGLGSNPEKLIAHIQRYFSPWWEQEIIARPAPEERASFGAHQFDPDTTTKFVIELPGNRSAMVMIDSASRSLFYSYFAE